MKAGLTTDELDARVHAPRGTVEECEVSVVQRVHPSLTAILARALGVYGSALDPRFDSNLNEMAASYADKVMVLALAPTRAKQVWIRLFGATGFRGAIPHDVWDEAFADEGGQAEMFR